MSGIAASCAAAVLALALCAAPAASRAAAAPDSAQAMGIHPLGRGGRDLSLVWETLAVSPRPAGCEVARRYRIRCRGRGGTYSFATAVDGPAGPAARFDSLITLAWNGIPIEYYEEVGRIEFQVAIGRSEVGEIDLRYFVPAAGEASLRFGVDHVSLYGEAFWAESRIPRIDVRFEPRGFGFSVETFLLEEPYAARARVERTGAAAALVWTIRNYASNEAGPAPVPLLRMPDGPPER